MKGFSLKKQTAILSLFLLMLCAWIIAPANAQNAYGGIVGTVTDPSGAVVPGVKVVLTNLGTNEVKSVQTDAAGNYRLLELLPTDYKLEFTRSNFKRYVQTPVTVLVGSTGRLDVAMELGAVSETVEVTTAAPLLQTESGTLGAQVEGKTVDEMPLNGRNTLNLISLVPGVVPQGASQGSTTLNQAGGNHTSATGWGNYQIGGSIAGQGATFIDGAPLNVLGNNIVGFVPTQDAIQEFKVSTSVASPEFGRFGGGVVEMSTKSGGNQFHGSAYEYLRNTVLNANSYFNKQSQLSAGEENKPSKWLQNQYGVAAGGPVVKNKAFFFFSWEDFSSRTGVFLATNTPDTQMMDDNAPSVPGNLTTTAVLPASQADCLSYDKTSNRTTIAKSCLDPSAQVFKNYFRTSTVAPGNNNYRVTSPLGADTTQYTARGDVNLSSSQRLFMRYTYMKMNEAPYDVMASNAGFKTGNAFSVINAHQGVIGDTYTINPTTIFDARLSFLRQYSANIPPSEGTDLAKLNVGSNWTNLAKYEDVKELPKIMLNGPYGLFSFFAMGITGYNWGDTDGLSFSLTKVKGNHTLKVGGEVRLLDQSALAGVNDGGITFTTNQYAKNEWANFLLGDLDNFSFGVGSSTAAYNWYQGYYAADTWTVNRKLTVNVGLRWELPGAIAERKDRAVVLLPDVDKTINGANAHGILALVNSDEWKNRSTEAPKHSLFSPRLGVAYRLSDSSVIRAGYSLVYVSPDLGGVLPSSAVINSATTTAQNNSSSAANYTLSNPFAFGTAKAVTVNMPTGRTNSNFMDSYANVSPSLQSISGPVPTNKYTYMEQWNLSVGHQFKADQSVEAGYTGALSLHLLPPSGWNMDQISQSTAYGLANQALSTEQAQAARPYSSYQNVTNSNALIGTANYNALQISYKKHFAAGGVISSGYTWSKSIGDSDSPNVQLDNMAMGTIQNYNNLKSERSVMSYSIAHRWITSYVVDLPFGRGKKYAAGYGGALDRVVSGWSINGITSFQSGHPLALQETSNLLSQNWGGGQTRPDVVTGCKKGASGSAASRAAKGWFNTQCFEPAGWNDANLVQNSTLYSASTNYRNLSYSMGNEPRVDSKLKAMGVDNWDFSVLKSTRIYDASQLQFRVEFFNIFNHTQFGMPNVSVDQQAFGTVTSQGNNPRQIQVSMRLTF